MKVSLIKPQGFCSGVLKAVSIAKKAKEEHPDKNVYILGMLAHNKTLTDDLTKEGLITFKNIELWQITRMTRFISNPLCGARS